MMNFWQKGRRPSWKALSILVGLFCMVPVFVFQLLPSYVGAAAAGVFGWGQISFFLSRHTVAYMLLQDIVRGVYAALAVGILDFLLLIFVYRLLDDVVTRQGKWRGVLAVAWRAVWPLLFRQVLVGFVFCVACWKINSFSALSLLPVFFSADVFSGLVMAVWGVSSVIFACAFAMTESGAGAMQFGWKILKAYWLMWLAAFVVIYLMTWFPAMLFSKFSVTGSGGMALFLMLNGSLWFAAFWTLLLSRFFNKPNVFALASSSQEGL